MKLGRFFFLFSQLVPAIFVPATLSPGSLAFPAGLQPAEVQERPVSPLAEGAEVEKLSGGFSFTEGPAVDGAGNVYFTDQPNNRILEWSTEGILTVYMRPAGRSNGLFFDRNGNLLACADEKNELWSIAPDQQITVLVKEYEGKALNGPNDLWVRPDGGLYFTDPFYKRPYWDHDTQPQEIQGVYFLSADRKVLKRVISDLVQPNGIIGTPDGSTLYVADIGGHKTYRYQIQSDGSLAGKELFCELGSDGMTIDDAGNVYLTGQGVTVFNRQGRQIDHIAIDERWTANVCFGGEDLHTLFITASKGLYSVRMRTQGVR